jgi:uncharacterized protein (DUF488 family)
MATPPTVPVIKTIGHGTRTLDELAAILQAHGVSRIVDVRKMPRSLANPQFNYETLPTALARFGIAYTHMPGLTGLRKRQRDSPNTGWRNKSFQAFADYMQSAAFSESIELLAAMSGSRDTAVMCAETVPWRCHRALIADALVVRGIPVQHLLSVSKATTHALPDFAKVEGLRITYPGLDDEPAPAEASRLRTRSHSLRQSSPRKANAPGRRGPTRGERLSRQ